MRLLQDKVTTFIILSSDYIINIFGWFFMLVTASFVVIAVILAFGKYGSVVLGSKDEAPQYSTFSWLCMLFAAGMGTGLIFYGAAEPLLHYMQPPPSSPSSLIHADDASKALALSYFHWGIHAWSIYALSALVIAYFSFCHNRPMLCHASVTKHRLLAAFINLIAAFAVICGLVATLSQGVLQLSNGIEYVFHWSNTSTMHMLQFSITIILTGAYTISASTSLSKGIKYLSILNIIIAVALLCLVLISADSIFLLEGFVTAIGDYLDSFVRQSFNMRHYNDTQGWLADWTITYFLWWIAWAPFVGIFIARISKGRSIRSFMLGVILVPTLFSALWFAIFGGAVLYEQIILQHDFSAVIHHPYHAIFMLLDTLPMAGITTIMTLFLLFIFMVTSADSGTYVLGIFSSKGNLNPSVRKRVFWGLIIGVITACSIMTGEGTSFFRAIAVFGGIPYLLLMIFQLIYLFKALRSDNA